MRLVIPTVLLPLLLSGCFESGAGPRSAADFRAISAAAEKDDLKTLTGLDAITDWPLPLWIEREREQADEAMRPLFLRGVTEISELEARTLATLPCSRLFLRDLASLDAPRATALMTGLRAGGLYLDGLKRLDIVTLRRLSEWSGGVLSLDGLERVDGMSATLLARFPGSVSLDGLAELSPQVAATLAGWEANGEQLVLSLDGVQSLTPEVARILASCKGWGLSLDGLVKPPREILRILGHARVAHLSLNGLKTLDDTTMKVLEDFSVKFVDLHGLKSLSAAQRQGLEAAPTVFSLRGVK